MMSDHFFLLLTVAAHATEPNLREGITLRQAKPELATNEGMEGHCTGLGQNFKALCVLLKENVIPTKSLCLCGKMAHNKEHCFLATLLL